jgi:predicted TIM-barrel fold metal-dependent hydrolase
VHLVGEDNLIWGSDYPHPDGIWPDSLKVIEADLGRLDARVRRKITCENAGKLYGFMS